MSTAIERWSPRMRILTLSLFGVVLTALTIWAVLLNAPAHRAIAGEQTKLDLNSSHVGATADGFGSQDCDDFDPLPAEDEDGWHFVAPGKFEFVSLTLSFKTKTGTPFTVEVPGADGMIDKGKHAYVYTPAGATLTGGSAEVAGDQVGNIDFFNLSHTCPSVPTTTTPPSSPPPSSPPPTSKPPVSPSSSISNGPSQTPSASVSPSHSHSASPALSASPTKPGGGKLPLTGTAIAGYVTGALVLLGGGAALMVLSRRRATNE